MSMTAPTLLTLREVASRTGVSPNTVRRWAQAGLVPGAVVTPGGIYKVPEASVDQLLRPVPVTGQCQEDNN